MLTTRFQSKLQTSCRSSKKTKFHSNAILDLCSLKKPLDRRDQALLRVLKRVNNLPKSLNSFSVLTRQNRLRESIHRSRPQCPASCATYQSPVRFTANAPTCPRKANFNTVMTKSANNRLAYLSLPESYLRSNLLVQPRQITLSQNSKTKSKV